MSHFASWVSDPHRGRGGGSRGVPKRVEFGPRLKFSPLLETGGSGPESPEGKELSAAGQVCSVAPPPAPLTQPGALWVCSGFSHPPAQLLQLHKEPGILKRPDPAPWMRLHVTTNPRRARIERRASRPPAPLGASHFRAVSHCGPFAATGAQTEHAHCINLQRKGHNSTKRTRDKQYNHRASSIHRSNTPRPICCRRAFDA